MSGSHLIQLLPQLPLAHRSLPRGLDPHLVDLCQQLLVLVDLGAKVLPGPELRLGQAPVLAVQRGQQVLELGGLALQRDIVLFEGGELRRLVLQVLDSSNARVVLALLVPERRLGLQQKLVLRVVPHGEVLGHLRLGVLLLLRGHEKPLGGLQVSVTLGVLLLELRPTLLQHLRFGSRKALRCLGGTERCFCFDEGLLQRRRGLRPHPLVLPKPLNLPP
mmetsp:Transcript_47597/g.119011  ORF Transcript_47597/g.119011 Transcript_47597/m.119011 type:complete len:219 (-) Transcript_47597:273-929(-)